jgi:O-antigen/teichoic acid export membrane protein
MIRQLRSRLSGLAQRPFVRGALVMISGAAFSQAIIVLASPILTRLYTEDAMGLFGVFVSLFTLLLAVNSLRYEYAIPLAENDRNAAEIIVLVVLILLITTVIFGAAFGLIGQTISALMRAPELAAYLPILLFSLLGAGVQQAFTYWAIRKQYFDQIAANKFRQSASLVLTQVGLGVLGLGPVGLLIGHAVGQVVSGVGMAQRVLAQDGAVFRQVQAENLRQMARRYRRFPLITSWSGFINTAGLQFPTLLMAAVYGVDIVGWFTMAQRVTALPMSLLGNTISQVFMSKASATAREDAAHLLRLYLRTAGLLLLVGLLPMAVLFVAGPPLFAWVFGENWATAGQFAQLMTPMLLAQFVVASTSHNIYVIERHDLQSIWDVVRLLSVFAVFFAAQSFALSAYATVGLLSFTMTANYILLFLINWWALSQHKRRLGV